MCQTARAVLARTWATIYPLGPRVSELAALGLAPTDYESSDDRSDNEGCAAAESSSINLSQSFALKLWGGGRDARRFYIEAAGNDRLCRRCLVITA